MMAAIPTHPLPPTHMSSLHLMYKAWLRTSCQAHGLQESLGSHGSLGSRGYDASVCVSRLWSQAGCR